MNFQNPFNENMRFCAHSGKAMSLFAENKNQIEILFIKDRGCPAATLRVWPWTHERTPLELCGDSLEEHSQILSESNLMQAS